MNTAQEPLADAVFNPPSFPIANFPEQVRTQEPTTTFACKSASSPAACDVPVSDANHPDRCQFMFSDGRQCRMERSEIHPSLCRFHAEREEQLFGDPAPGGGPVVGAGLDLPELYSACRDLTTAAGVNRALAQVFRLLAQRRISRQEAATFCHLGHLLLRTISAVRAEYVAPPRDCVSADPILPPVHARSVAPIAGHETSPVPSDPAPLGVGAASNAEAQPVQRKAPGHFPGPSSRSFQILCAKPPNSELSQNEHLLKMERQLAQNEHLRNLST